MLRGGLVRTERERPCGPGCGERAGAGLLQSREHGPCGPGGGDRAFQASSRAERTGRAVRAGGEQAGQASARAESGQCGLELMPSPAASEFMLITQLSVNL